MNAPQTNNIVVVNSGACSAGCGGSSNTVNLHTFAFDKIAAIKYGNVRIRIRQVMTILESSQVRSPLSHI